MEQSLVKIALATLSVAVVLDIVTHGDASAKIAESVTKGWIGILAVLTGQSRPSGF
jgi:hypothetical protein